MKTKRNLIQTWPLGVALFLTLGAVIFTANAQIILAQTDFGTTPGTNVAPFTTDYQPWFSHPPIPGQYQIGTNGVGYGPSDWAGVDHTTGTGCFALFDGSQNSTQAVISCTIYTVAGSTYTLSGWAMNLVASGCSPAKLAFRANGSEYGTFALIGAQTWHQFTFTYTPVASGLTTFALHDDNTDYGCNDFGLDDLTLTLTPAPTLAIALSGANVAISWPTNGSYTLQQDGDLTTTNWVTSGYTINTSNGTNSITIISPTGNLFFRLAK